MAPGWRRSRGAVVRPRGSFETAEQGLDQGAHGIQLFNFGHLLHGHDARTVPESSRQGSVWYGELHPDYYRVLHELHDPALVRDGFRGRIVCTPHTRDLAGIVLPDSGRLNEEEAALELGLSRRTLVRRLSESGTSFRQMLDAEMKARARGMLDEGTLSRTDMAEALGFDDPTSFSRACRRWFGQDGT